MNKSTSDSNALYVWDKCVRATHWIVAFAVIFNFFSETGWIHRYVGYLAACLVLLRLLYGLPIFASWVKSGVASRLQWPAAKDIFHHVAEIRSGTVSSPLGHNPLGQLAAYLMWALVLSLAISGWLAGTDAYWGEDWPVDTHVALSDALQVIVVIHFCGVALMSKLQKENLLSAMVTGKKRSSRSPN